MSDYQYLVYLKALSQDVKTDSNYDISTAIQNLESVENFQETIGVSKTSSLYKNSSDAATMVYPDQNFGKDGFMTIFSKDDGIRLKKDYSSVLTSELEKYSSKLYKLLQYVNKSPGNVFIYSNYVSYGGTSLLKQLLLHNGYKQFKGRGEENYYKNFVLFDDSTDIETREKLRRIFNSPENKNGKFIKIIIGSPVISEGITLKNVRQLHILEPSWNMSRINQIVGRAIRNYSHKDLSEEDRNVEIYKYVSVYSKVSEKSPKSPKSGQSGPNSPNHDQETNLSKFFIDKEKYVLSEEKDRSNKRVERLLKENSFDCKLMEGRNEYDESYNGKAECDYQNCKYDCKININNDSLSEGGNKSTYKMYISFFDKYDNVFITNIIRNLFTNYFIWHLHDIVDKIKELDENISNEAIYTTLGNIVNNKILINDMYNRDGFVIQKGPYYIFNPSDVDIQSSIYSKMLDFTVNKNKFTLEQYINKSLNTSLFDTKDKEEIEETVNLDIPLTEADIEYNMNIITNNQIFGTYRQRSTKDSIFGPRDDKFRVIDMRKLSDEIEDKRKAISGMWIGSFKKPKLIEIIQYLKIETPRAIKQLDKEQLGNVIKKYLEKNNLILR